MIIKDVTEKILVGENDEWTCECGNTAFSDGFYPCDEDGSICEPDSDDWGAGHVDMYFYFCCRCGLVVNGIPNSQNLETIGRVSPETMAENDEYWGREYMWRKTRKV